MAKTRKERRMMLKNWMRRRVFEKGVQRKQVPISDMGDEEATGERRVMDSVGRWIFERRCVDCESFSCGLLWWLTVRNANCSTLLGWLCRLRRR